MAWQSRDQGFPAIAPNGADLPYAVKVKGWALVYAILAYGGGLLIGLAVAVATFWGKHNALGVALVELSGVSGALLCAWLLWRLRSPVAIFYPDRVEKRGLLGWRTLSRSEISGVGKVIATRYGSYFLIYPAPSAGTPMQMNGAMRNDRVVAAWLAGALDPEAEAIKADRAAVLADSRYGATEADREARLEFAKKAMTGFNLVCLAGAAWLGFYGALTLVDLVLAAAVLLAGWLIVAASNGLIVWTATRSARPSVMGAVTPILALTARAGVTVHLLDNMPMIWGAVAVWAIASALILFRGAVTKTPGAGIALGLVAGFAAYGFAALINVALDTAPQQISPVSVLGKHTSGGRSTSYYLNLAPWPAKPAGGNESVSPSLYDHAPIGAYICVFSHPGALRMAWYDISYCPKGTQPPAPAPTDPSAFYPDRAQRLDIEGSAVVECSVSAADALGDCRALSETPPGYGFAAAAVNRVQSMNLHPGKTQLTAQGKFQTRVVFKLAN